MPRTAPQPKDDETPAPQEKPTTIAGLIGNLFGSSKPEPVPARMAASEPVTLRGANTDLAAKPKQVAPVRTASAVPSAPMHTAPAPTAPAPTIAAPAPKPREPAPKAPVETARPPAPATTSSVQTAKADPQRAPQPEIRTAYSTPPAASGGLLSGAQPVVPAGSFNSFR
jgi:hypothetical protein